MDRKRREGGAEERRVGPKGEQGEPPASLSALTHHVLEGGHRHVRPHREPNGDCVHLGILHAHPQPAGRARALDEGPASATS